MRAQAIGRKVQSSAPWEAAMVAEEIAWISMCRKMRASAKRMHPEDEESQNAVFESMRQQALAHHWRGPQ